MGRGGIGAVIVVLACVVTLVVYDASIAALGDCGQPVSSGPAPVATDALFALAAAVGTQSCAECVCDVDASGGGNPVSATDALIILRRAVDPLVTLSCAACTIYCELSSAPECGGTCANGGTCAPEPTDPSECSCLGSCELGPAPACGGACDGPYDDPSDVCTSIEVSIGGGSPEPACICIPDGVVACEDSSRPACQGVCHGGATCEQQGNACVCVAQPPQGACSAASGPACAGVCGTNEICQNDGGSCACVPWTSSAQESCASASIPTCGGACGGGRVCAVEIGGGSCECLTPCETGVPQTCGGACTEPGDVCVTTAVSVGSSTLEYCDCATP